MMGLAESTEAKRLAEIKATLEKRVKQLEEEADLLKSILAIIDAQLLKIGFRPAELIGVPSEEEYKQVIPIRTRTGKPLAMMYVGEKMAKIIPEEKLAFNVNTPPFRAFLIDRVFNGMVAKDKKMVEAGELSPEKVFSYRIIQGDDIIKEIIIWNFREPRRLREIRSSVRWTLERMAERVGFA
jgi:hypothetical protein